MKFNTGMRRLVIVAASAVVMMVLLILLEKRLTLSTLFFSLLLSLFAIGAGWGLYQTILWIKEGFEEERQ